MKVELHPEARAEFLESVAHYATIQPALAERFIESVNSCLEGIGENSKIGAEIEQDVRRRLTRVFPYALLYTIEPDRILVVAVMHCHQKPSYWRSRRAGG